MNEPNRFSGKKIVLILAVTAIAAWIILLASGMKAKAKRLDSSGKPRVGLSDTLPPAK